MFVLCAGIYFQFFESFAAKRIFREHPFDCFGYNPVGVLCHKLFERLVARAAGIKRVVVIILLLHALAGHFDLSGIDYNDEIPGIYMRRKSRFMLASQ